METITFHCKVITPMFLAGADGQTPELRAPSIKGAMRFWWRAMNGHLVKKDEKTGKWDYSKLKEAEGEIFGDTEQRSKISIRLLKYPSHVSNIELLPHKENEWHRSPKDCFPVGEEFTLWISLVPNNLIDLEKVESLFKVLAILGGLGKRSRRGMGSFQILNIDNDNFVTPETEEEITAIFKKVSPEFSYNISVDYPIIKKLEISNNPISIYGIGKATHDEKIATPSTSYSNKKGKKVTKYPNYDATIGSGNPRYASPVYISILPSGKAIITTLSTLSPKPKDVQMIIQDNLKKRIL